MSTGKKPTRPESPTDSLVDSFGSLNMASTPSTAAGASKLTSPSVTNLGVKGVGETKLKISEPESFDGSDRSKFKAFDHGVRACIKYGGITDPEAQVVWTGNLLRGKAAKWFEPHMSDYLKHDRKKDRKPRTQELFGGIDIFLKDLGKLYGEEESERKLERQLRNLRQRGSVLEYTAEFTSVTEQMDRTPEALYPDYYHGLKDWIKDEIAKRDEDPENLDDLISFAETLDKRIWERKMEKSKTFGTTKKFQKGSNYKKTYRKDPDAMEWEANKAFRPDKQNPKKKKNTLTDAQRKRFKNGECITCGKKGHFAKECKGKRVNTVEKNLQNNAFSHKDQPPKQGKRAELDISNTQHPKHGQATWTACYDDDCHWHRPDKEGTGWFPRKPRKTNKRVNMVRKIVNEPIVERDPIVISTDDDKTVIETWYWYQIRTDEEAEDWQRPKGEFVHNPDGCRRSEPVHITIWLDAEETDMPEDILARHARLRLGNLITQTSAELSTPDVTTWRYNHLRQIYRYAYAAIDVIDRIRQVWISMEEGPNTTDPLSYTLRWEKDVILVHTQEWRCLTCSAVQGCVCYPQDTQRLLYIPGVPPTGKYISVYINKCTDERCPEKEHHGHQENLTPRRTQVGRGIILTKQLWELPHKGLFARQYEGDTSEEESESEQETQSATKIVDAGAEFYALETTRWFQDWCRNPECEQERQHKHKYFNPNSYEKEGKTICMWYKCRQTDCKEQKEPHAHQMCYTEARQTLPLSYFQKLPRQDDPDEESAEEEQPDVEALLTLQLKETTNVGRQRSTKE